MSANRLSLAQQIALLEEAAPADIDPEDAFSRDFPGENIITTDPAVRQHYVEVGPSHLRRMHDSLVDPKYKGKLVTRKQMEEEEEPSEDDVDDEAEEDEERRSSAENNSEFEDDPGLEQHAASSYTEEEEEDDDDDDGEDEEQDEEVVMKDVQRKDAPPSETAEDLSSTLRRKREEDYEKGKAVSRQIALWDSLLDARIRLQKSVIVANKIPRALDLKQYASAADCQDAIKRLMSEAAALSDELISLHQYLLTSNESIQPPPRKRRRVEGSDTLENYNAWVQEATDDMSALEASYHPHLVQTLAKWSAKVQAVSPAVLLPSNRGTFASKGTQKSKSVLQVMDEVLVDHDKLLARTRMRRSKMGRLGEPEGEDEQDEPTDPEIFDDTDFYQQMLRDVIESKGNGSQGDDWAAAQKQRKAKKKVDTKASKGRKLRYEVHEKIQNFMVPVPTVGGWHEEQIDELFASLLGKGFESVQEANHGKEGEIRMDDLVNDSLKEGFRVFG